MRLREQVIGALNLFSRRPGSRPGADIRIGQALADVATIGLLQHRARLKADTVAEQLQTALNSRVMIEQAKGKLAERLGIDMDQAFNILRDHARAHNRKLSDLARAVVEGTEDLSTRTGHARPTHPLISLRSPGPACWYQRRSWPEVGVARASAARTWPASRRRDRSHGR